MSWVFDLAKMYGSGRSRTNLFGIILYTDAHPHVKKMLRDDDYWKSLHEISGPRWTVFATKAVSGSWERSRPAPGLLNAMEPVWREPADNKQLLDAFGIESTSELPALAVFAEDEDGHVERAIVPISDVVEREAFNSLRQVFEQVGKALERVDESAATQGTAAFRAAQSALRGLTTWSRLRRGVEMWRWLRSLV